MRKDDSMKLDKRLIVSLITGALLGVVCILGATLRYSETLSNSYLFAFWFNRLLMGFVIGLVILKGDLYIRLIKGAIIGLIVSFAFYSATDFYDLIGFIVGAAYGAIIVYVNHIFIGNKSNG